MVTRFAFQHPLRSWHFLRAPSTLSRLLERRATAEEIHRWIGEAGAITREIQRRLGEAAWEPGKFPGATATQDRGPILYAITRALQPEYVLETGVANGSSTYYFLAAMKANGKGKLHSIDLPPGKDLSSDYRRTDAIDVARGHEPAWLVPEELRSNWEFHLGDTREVLPKVLAALPPLDFFFHDSEHTYEAMMFEYESAWPRLKTGAILGSDDVALSRAFFDFARAKRLPRVLVGGFAFTRKSPV